ncbi:hypothetical protein [Pseudomonas amygdali]|uniref:Lipoprotein n=1 Tax=Pseudomonas amygdali pv. lachrymans str. M301315 TaxID=629260 RepID=A0AAD0M5B5_PSEAV|nr:hypothetical protein [Pseudomonas amygdali]AXH59559.1 hypothetical protein PLA107_030505 [Pseudomonas amygdali pv. lachrymans str. M301315]RMT05926.1 hypothetical protein ALP54_03481 [Pseudomonas amygdali pv. lachrymans]
MTMFLNSKLPSCLGLLVITAVLAGCATPPAPAPKAMNDDEAVSEVFIAAAKQCHSDKPGSVEFFKPCLKSKLDASIEKLQLLSKCVSSEGCRPTHLQLAPLSKEEGLEHAE